MSTVTSYHLPIGYCVAVWQNKEQEDDYAVELLDISCQAMTEKYWPPEFAERHKLKSTVIMRQRRLRLYACTKWSTRNTIGMIENNTGTRFEHTVPHFTRFITMRVNQVSWDFF